MRREFTGTEQFLGLTIQGGVELHPKARRFLSSIGYTVSYKSNKTIIEMKQNYASIITQAAMQARGECIQKEIDAEIAKERFEAALAPLTRYSVTYLPSIFSSICSLFGHHHENRVQAIINALKTASIEESTKILSHQVALMAEKNPNLSPLTNSNIVNSALLDYRWQTRLPGHRDVPNSGYLTALKESLASFQLIQSNQKPSAAASVLRSRT